MSGRQCPAVRGDDRDNSQAFPSCLVKITPARIHGRNIVKLGTIEKVRGCVGFHIVHANGPKLGHLWFQHLSGVHVNAGCYGYQISLPCTSLQSRCLCLSMVWGGGGGV